MSSPGESGSSIPQEMKRILREDWTTIPFLMIVIAGGIVAMLDFIFLQNLRFQVYAVAGLILFLVGAYFRIRARLELRKKAGFESLVGTARVQIVKEHKLVKDGLYKHIRHPLYLGEILRNFGFVLFFSSLFGILLVAVSVVFLLFRIRMEERMLIGVFGEEYKEYMRNTKRLIPYLF